ncbi:beta-ketoacyl-[acyl-carrier-protein] synthase family protein [Streptomyces spectabilis]|uniref:Beta-ketoacyl-[acyl-carrier-protein] synthase family protein n=1 Tax=Streptomyces spectabilis TaxID=68270 RepID=A0A516R132_STRST|nr:beta-ketoacyl-[acyl-carrier-protein] synthase family protein [Streptomyces spectabilis]QDQ09368.1 beta-ketoacyl-[acyl-carrier-protein] synthase family protein [Streptomyces spectabilis]
MAAHHEAFDVAVTGVGLVTAGGIGADATWDLLLTGEPTAAVDAELQGLPVDFSCRVPGFDADELLGRRTAWRQDRFTHFGLVAAREALAQSGLDPTTWDGARVGIVVGNALGGTKLFEEARSTLMTEGPLHVPPMLIPQMGQSSLGGFLAIDCAATGPNLTTVTACASGATAIGTARELLRSRVCDVVLTGGTEAAISPTIIAGFHQIGALSRRVEDPAAASRPFDVGRDGFVAAEGAGMLVLERPADATARGARPLALLSGYGASADAHHPTAPQPGGAGVERAVRAALADAGLSPRDIDHINAHGTSTPLNDVAEAQLVRRVFGDRPAVTAVKGSLGHTLGAAGAIEAVCTVLSVRRGVVPPTANCESQDPRVELDIVTKVPRALPVRAAVSNSFGFGGLNAVLVVTEA